MRSDFFHAFSILWLHLLCARIVLAGQLCASNIPRRVPQSPSARLPIQLIPSTSKNVGPHGIHGVLMDINGVCYMNDPWRFLPFQGRSRYLRDKAAGTSKAQRIPKLSRPSHLEALRQVASSAGHWWAHNTFLTDKVNSDIQWHLDTDKALSWPEGLTSAELFAAEVEPHHGALSCLAYINADFYKASILRNEKCCSWVSNVVKG